MRKELKKFNQAVEREIEEKVKSVFLQNERVIELIEEINAINLVINALLSNTAELEEMLDNINDVIELNIKKEEYKKELNGIYHEIYLEFF
ncbi:MAG: hypothetical protein ACTSR3_00965 [Candidatus Helarchaeota archaeon]